MLQKQWYDYCQYKTYEQEEQIEMRIGLSELFKSFWVILTRALIDSEVQSSVFHAGGDKTTVSWHLPAASRPGKLFNHIWRGVLFCAFESGKSWSTLQITILLLMTTPIICQHGILLFHQCKSSTHLVKGEFLGATIRLGRQVKLILSLNLVAPLLLNWSYHKTINDSLKLQ